MGGRTRTQIAARPMWGKGAAFLCAAWDSMAILGHAVKPMPLHAEALGSHSPWQTPFDSGRSPPPLHKRVADGSPVSNGLRYYCVLTCIA